MAIDVSFGESSLFLLAASRVVLLYIVASSDRWQQKRLSFGPGVAHSVPLARALIQGSLNWGTVLNSLNTMSLARPM